MRMGRPRGEVPVTRSFSNSLPPNRTCGANRIRLSSVFLSHEFRREGRPL
jgi:hypothetical protein